MGFQQNIFEKTDVLHETAIFGPKKPKPEIPDLCFAFSFSVNNKNTNNGRNPYFYNVLANIKRDFSNVKLKTEKFGEEKSAPIFWKRPCLDNWQTIGHKKNTKW